MCQKFTRRYREDAYVRYGCDAYFFSYLNSFFCNEKYSQHATDNIMFLFCGFNVLMVLNKVDISSSVS